MQIHGDGRRIRAKLVVECGHRAGIGERTEDGPCDVAGKQLPGRENHHAEQQKRQRAQHGATRDGVEGRGASHARAASCRKICEMPLTCTPVTLGPVAQM